ncbi:MAG: CBS domain-containing protein [Nitrospiraceae bacterium]
MNTNTDSFCIARTATVGETAAMMDRSRLGIVLVVDERHRLVGTVTDGDLRRAMLTRIDLGNPVEVLLEQKAGSVFSQPISAALGQDPNWYLQLLQRHSILHLPILDQEQRVVGLVTRDEFLPRQVLPLQAVIMAGEKAPGSTPHRADSETDAAGRGQAAARDHHLALARFRHQTRQRQHPPPAGED